MDDILRSSYHNAQNGICAVFYKVVEQIMLDLLRKDGIGETVNAHIAKVLDTNAAANRLPEIFLILKSIMMAIAKVVQRKPTLSLQNRIKYCKCVKKGTRGSHKSIWRY